MKLSTLKETRRNIISIWNRQSRQSELYRKLKKQEKAFDKETLEELLQLNKEKTRLYDEMIENLDKMIEQENQ